MGIKDAFSQLISFKNFNLIKLKFWVVVLVVLLYVDTLNILFIHEKSPSFSELVSAINFHTTIFFVGFTIAVLIGVNVIFYTLFLIISEINSRFVKAYQIKSNNDYKILKSNLFEFAFDKKNEFLLDYIKKSEAEDKERELSFKVYFFGVLLVVTNLILKGSLYHRLITDMSQLATIYFLSFILLIIIVRRFDVHICENHIHISTHIKNEVEKYIDEKYSVDD